MHCRPWMRVSILTVNVIAFLFILLEIKKVTWTESEDVDKGDMDVMMQPEYQLHPLNIINPYKKNFQSYNCSLITTKTTPSYQVCIHDFSWDNGISRYFKDYGAWEAEYIPNLQTLLGSYPNLGFFDIGANIGAYTLQAAAMGHHTVSVEPTDRHMGALCESVKANNFNDRVVLIKNVISDEYNNYSANFDQQLNPGAANMVKYHGAGNVLTSVTLNDLVQVATFSTALMKIDIEGHEDIALRKAEHLFRSVYIPYVMMEWVFFRNVITNATRAEWIVNTMKSHGYSPFSHNGDNMAHKDYHWYGIDVIWIHKEARRVMLKLKS